MTNIPWRLNLLNRLHFLTVPTFLFCFHSGASHTLAPNARVAIFPVKHVSLHSIASPSPLLSWKNLLWLDMLLSGSNWKPITLLSKSIFTLIRKDVRDLLLGNNEYTRDEGFFEGLWHKLFSTRLISCYYFDFIGLLSLV